MRAAALARLAGRKAIALGGMSAKRTEESRRWDLRLRRGLTRLELERRADVDRLAVGAGPQAQGQIVLDVVADAASQRDLMGWSYEPPTSGIAVALVEGGQRVHRFALLRQQRQ